MKKIHESELETNRVHGQSGYVDVMDAIDTSVTAGVRLVGPNSEVPARPHSHADAQIIYVVTGRPRIQSEKATLQLRPGDFVILEAFEEHYILTDELESKIFEVKFPQINQ